MTSSLTPSRLARFATADVPLRRSICDWGIRGVSAFGAAACRVIGPRVVGQFGILLYHRVAEEVAGIARPSINVPPRQFERQIRGLVQAGFVFWPLRRVQACLARGEQIPPYVVVLTFDDGFQCVYQNAWPVLRELNLPATVFLPTAYLGSEEPFPFDHWGQTHSQTAPPVAYRPMTVAQCRELAASGLIEFGAHTHTHEDFRGRPAAFREDLETNVEALEALFGRSDVSFAFPYGTPRLGFADDSLTAAARAAGVRCALTTRSALIKSDDSPFAWGRFTVFAWDNAATIAAKLGGWYGWAPEFKNRVLGRSAVTSHSPRSTRHVTRVHAPRAACPTNISVIVPTFNRAGWLADALHSLTRQRTDGKFEFEIVVCDNASTDETARVVASAAESSTMAIKYCYQPQPGDAPTRNLAVQHATGQWLAFFDDDQLAPENWLGGLLAAAEKTSGAIVGGPVQLDVTARQRAECGPHLCAALRETDLYARLQPYLGQALPGTGNALVARCVFEAIGDFDESFVNGGSDYDFFARARAAGFSLWYTPDAPIRHRVDPQRLSSEHLRLDALSGGAEHAEQIDFQRGGWPVVLAGGLARASQAFLVHGPLLLAAWLRHDRGNALGQRIRLWRAEGYLRKALALVAPQMFPQQHFFNSMTFRHGRPPTKGRS